MKFKTVFVIFGLSWASTISAHPHDNPLVFRKHLTDDGRVIYNNIPKACFSNGLLTCDHLHPIYGMPVAPKGSKSESAKKTRAASRTSTTTSTTSIDCGLKTTCSDMSSCGEARRYFNQCPGLSGLYGNKDGTPCEDLC